MKRSFIWLLLLAVAGLRIIDLQRRLQASQMRGDMYRDISMRLDRRIAELTSEQQPQS
jgi:hypothetical protein